MPVLREKPKLKPKPICLGCDHCGRDSEDEFYALAPNDKYYCKDCFFGLARKWKRPRRKSGTEEEGRRPQVSRTA